MICLLYNNKSMNENYCVLLIRTVQISPIRNLFQSLKDIIRDLTTLLQKMD